MEGNWVSLGVVARCWNEILIWDCLFTAIFGNISMEDMKRMCNIGEIESNNREWVLYF